jgi:hypothetical protein
LLIFYVLLSGAIVALGASSLLSDPLRLAWGDAVEEAIGELRYEGSSSHSAPAPAGREMPDGRDAASFCTLSFGTISVGQCTYDEGTGQSRVLVAVFLNWTNAPVGQSIAVTYKGQTRTLDPSVPAIPNFVQFIVPADGSTSTVTAAFSGGACIAPTQMVTLPPSCAPSTCGDPGTIGGRVFADFNNNGSRQASEFGVEDVTVVVFNEVNI